MCVKRMSSHSGLFGSFFAVCHPYIDVHFVKCFLCDLCLPFFWGVIFLFYHGVSWLCGEECGASLRHESGNTSRPEHAT